MKPYITLHGDRSGWPCCPYKQATSEQQRIKKLAETYAEYVVVWLVCGVFAGILSTCLYAEYVLVC